MFPFPEGSQTDHPPTLSIQASGIRESAAYFVRVDISRRGILQLKLKSQKELVFRPSNDAPLPSARAAVTAMLSADAIDPRKSVPYQAPYLLQYSPSMEVELRIPSPPVLYPGAPLDVKLAGTITED